MTTTTILNPSTKGKKSETKDIKTMIEISLGNGNICTGSWI